MPYSLLLIDSDARSNDLLASAPKEDFRLEVCKVAYKALERLRSASFDLILLGGKLTDMPGLAFLRILRDMESGKAMPAIFLPDGKMDKSMAEAFELGVDDYLAKPYDLRELLMRIRAVLRRKYERQEHWGGELTVAGVYINPGQRLCIVDGKRISLRPLEFALLDILLRKSGRVLSRPYLLATIWEMSSSSDTRAVDAMISRLRRSLGKRAGKLIETVSKMGYCFRVPDPL